MWRQTLARTPAKLNWRRARRCSQMMRSEEPLQNPRINIHTHEGIKAFQSGPVWAQNPQITAALHIYCPTLPNTSMLKQPYNKFVKSNLYWSSYLHCESSEPSWKIYKNAPPIRVNKFLRTEGKTRSRIRMFIKKDTTNCCISVGLLHKKREKMTLNLRL